MATFTTYAREGSGNTTNSVGNIITPTILKKEIDLAQVYTNNPTIASADSVEIWRFPQYTILTDLQFYLATALTNITRIDVGDVGSATRYVSNHATFTSGAVMTQAVTTGPLLFYTSSTAANNAILMKLTATVASMTGTIVCIASIIDAKRSAPAVTPLLG